MGKASSPCSPFHFATDGVPGRYRASSVAPRTNKAEAPVVVESEVLTSRHANLDDLTFVFEAYHVEFTPK